MAKNVGKISSLIKKFSPYELPEVLGNTFGSDTWNELNYFASKRKISLSNSQNVATVCLKIYKSKEPSVADIQKVLWYLQFFDTLLHHTVLWKCALLANKEDNFPSNLEELQRKIKQSYRSEARDVEMVITMKEELTWVMLIEKKITKRGIKYGKPFFIVINVNLEEPYVFYYPGFDITSNEIDHLMLLSKSLGYEEYKKVSFEGKDVKSLFNMIKRHKTERNQIAVFQPRKIVFEDNVLDFTKGKDRLQYATDVLPPGLTNLSEFSVYSRDEWRGDSPLCGPCQAASQLRIRTKGRSSIEAVFREMITLGLISIPVPHYISQLPYLNRNVVQLKNIDNTHSTVQNDN